MGRAHLSLERDTRELALGIIRARTRQIESAAHLGELTDFVLLKTGSDCALSQKRVFMVESRIRRTLPIEVELASIARVDIAHATQIGREGAGTAMTTAGTSATRAERGKRAMKRTKRDRARASTGDWAPLLKLRAIRSRRNTTHIAQYRCHDHQRRRPTAWLAS